ncbi:MAG: M1 family metallopeptidase [Microthrixaceae bacterium]
MGGRSRALLVAALVVAATAAVVATTTDRERGDRAAPSGTTTSDATTSTTLVGQAGADGVGDPYFPKAGNGGYDVEHYDLEITWQPEGGTIVGRTVISARATQDLSRFNLDLSGLDVASVVVDDEPAAVARVAEELEITPAAPIPKGTAFTATITYGGSPVPRSDGTDLFDVGWHTDGREAFVVSEPVGAVTFFPANDHPTDKATYTFVITAPADQTVVANGLLAEPPVERDGLRTWTYEATDPMASYLVQVVIGDLELVDGGKAGDTVIRHAFHRSVAKAATVAVARTSEMIDVLDDVYGPYPFEAYGVVVVDEALGFALETQTLTIIGTDIASAGRDADIVLLHELAHQWMGNTVSLSSWKDIWLNEGFATYSEWLWTERTGGPSAAASAREVPTHPKLAVPPGDPGAQELFGPTVYHRGGMALQALREKIGDGPFFAVLRAWVDEHLDGSASTPDFVALAERISGQELDDLFQTWLYSTTQPRLG